ncbi:MAG TPA: DUF4089 domain-containing protein [Rhodopila sp.]|nr:DUF4089 domain-containing protein [Rhodopila sp.]
MDETQLDALIDAGTAVLGIEMQPEWRDAVRMHLAISLGHAQAVLDEPVDDRLDPAPVFRA